MNFHLKKLTFMAMFLALSVVGAYIKVPSPTGTIAFDSMPAYLGGLLLGGTSGAVIGFVGHMITSAYAGFPLTLPVHLLIAMEMAFIVILYSWMVKKIGIIAGGVIGSLLNGVASPAILALMPGYGMGFFIAMVFPLLVGSIANVVLSIILYKGLEKSKVIQQMDVFSDDKTL
ncbi:ECF transporter S component [Garciella nitratireducens]|uniref:Alpha-ribazole transporter n=1 Tax=Garciella nitratireducens DSM 15102 TaxID=1121911 RepID=A0A1T4PN17_9FIRM|nr:ECF transporter S component [Garciella nitratireducens]SJZ92984.1 alpha-ribazole transporter [Garciella nitratireducens DSM 15102]